jgi:spore coat polysaccharide biosynthesis predicted glycosyltransferase SpsG
MARQLGCPSNLIEIVDHGDAVELLAEARVALVATSTTAYHALMARVPLVVLDYLSDEIRFDTGNAGGAAVVHHPADLALTLHRAIEDEDYRRELLDGGRELTREHLFHLDGHAASRVASVIQRVISERD